MSILKQAGFVSVLQTSSDLIDDNSLILTRITWYKWKMRLYW